MNNESNKPQDTLTHEEQNQFNLELNKLDIQFVQTVKLNELQENSVLIFRIAEDNLNLIMALPLLCEKYKDILKSKKVAVLIINPEESFEVLNEQQMRKLGWIRENDENRKRIITLG